MARDVAEMEVEEMAVDAGTLEGPKVDEGDGCIRSCLVKFDLAVSSPIFEARLPSVLEWALSVPGSIFGMPLPMTMSPLVMASADSTVASALCLELVSLPRWPVCAQLCATCGRSHPALYPVLRTRRIVRCTVPRAVPTSVPSAVPSRPYPVAATCPASTASSVHIIVD